MAYVDKNSFHSIDTTSTQTIEKTKLPGTDGKHSIDQGTQTISPKYLEKTNISFSLKFVLKVRTVLYQIKTTFSSLAKINASVNKDSLSIEQAKVLFLSSKTTPEQKLTLVSKFGTELIDAENASTMDNTLDTLLKSDSLSPIDKNKVLNFMLDVGKPISNSILNDLVEKGINKDGGTSLKEIYNNPNLVDKLTDKTRTRLLEHLFSSKYISSEDKCNILNAQLHYKKSNSFTNWNPSNTMQEISKMISSNEDNASQLFDNLISKNDNIYKNLDPFSKLNLCDKIFQSNNVSIENKISLGKTFLNENNDFASKIKLCEKIFQSEIFSTENKGEALGKLLNEIPILKDDTRNKFLPKLNSMIDSLVESGKDNGKALSHCLINNKGVWYLNLSSYTNTCKKICQSREVSLSDKGEALKKLASNRFVNNFSSIARTVYETTDGITADQLNEIVHNLPLSEEQKEKVELLISEIENNEIYNQENEISKKMVKELSNNPENKTEIIHKSIEDCKSFMAKSCGINVKTLEDKNKTLLEKFSQEITEYVDKNISDLSSKDEAERNFHIADMPFQLKQIIDKVLKDIKTDDFEIGYYNFPEDDYIDSNELFNYDDLNEIHVYQNDQEFDVGASISDENLFDPSTTENKPKELTLKDAQSNLQNLKNMLNSANLSTSINSLSKDIESLQVIGTNEDQLKDFQNMLQTLKNIRQMTNNPELFIKANDDGLDRYIESLSQDIKSLQESGVNESQLKGFHDVLQSFQQAKSIRNTAKNDLQFIRDNFKTFAGNNEAIDKAVDLLSRDMADFTKAGIVNDEIGPSNELIDNFKEILNSLQQAKESIFKDSQTFEAPKLETQQTFHQIPPNTLQTPTNMSSFGGLPPIPTPLSSTPTNSDSINAPKSHHINPSIQAKIDMIENNKSNQTINNEINRSTTLQNQNKMNALKKDFGNLISNLKGSSESNIDKLQKVNTFVENLDKNLNLNNVKDEKVLDNQIKLMSDMQALFQSTFANIGDNLGKYVGQQIKKSSIKSAQEDLASIPAYNVTRTLDVIITHLKDMKKSINNPEKMGYIEEDLHTMLQDRSKAIDNSKLLFQHMDMKNFTINGTPITPAVFAENNEMEKFIEKNKLQSDF